MAHWRYRGGAECRCREEFQSSRDAAFFKHMDAELQNCRSAEVQMCTGRQVHMGTGGAEEVQRRCRGGAEEVQAGAER